jgi:hypothetical protein
VCINTLNSFLAWSLLVVLGAGFSPLQALDEPAEVKVVLERIERVSRDEVHFSLKVANGSGRPVFLAGINFDRPIPYPLFLEQWRTEEGWKIVVPCMDVPPPHVIKLSPSGAITLDLVLKVPLSGVCKERNIQLEGGFRFRLDYFESEKQARTYLRKIFSPDWQSAHAAVAVSEPFEIPPYRDPNDAQPNH